MLGIYAAAVTAALALLAAVLASLEWQYSQAFEAYRLAHMALGQWESLAGQLPTFACLVAEDRALRAVEALDPGPYVELPALLRAALGQVRARSLLRLSYTVELDGEDLRWSVRLGRAAVAGEVTWLRPLTLIGAVRAISSAQLGEGGGMEGLVPPGFTLSGVIYGELDRCGGGIYCGTLHGSYLIAQRQPLRCLPGRLERGFSAEHAAVVYTYPGDNRTSIYVEWQVYIER